MSAYAAIPEELRERPQWVLWRFEERDGRTTKVPYRPREPFVRGSSTDASSWASFELALAVADQADGLGFVFTPDDAYCGIDLDAELPEADRAAIALALGSYTEVSPSGVGWHVIVRASLNGHARHRSGGLEVYDRARFFTMTGERVRGTPETIEERQAELEAVLAEFLPPPEPTGISRSPAQPVALDDRELLERMFRSRSGAKIARLWRGDTSGYPSRSEADLALATHLAFWTGRDAARIDRLFRLSRLYREKWGRQDYREATIEKAIAGTAEVFQPTVQVQRQAPNAVDGEREKEPPPGGTERAYGVRRSAYRNSDTPTPYPRRVEEYPGTALTPDAEAEPERPFALAIREFVKVEREHREPLLASSDGRAVVGRHSLILLGALGGHGKTTLFIDLSLHLAAGVGFPPWSVPRPVSILLIENEGPEELFAEKLAARLEHFPHELQARLDVCTFDWGGFSLADAGHRERLTREIAEKGYELVFGDPLDALGIEGVGSPEDTRKFLGLMKETGLNRTVAWWLNTHPRKEETREALNEISGAWGGKPDSVFLLRMLDDDRSQLRQPKLRWARRGKGPTLLFTFDPDTEAFAYIGEQGDEERDYLAEIRELLADGEWRIVKEIATGIKAGDKTLEPILERHPDVFEMRTGEEAVALGRRGVAQLWQLRTELDEEDEP